MTVQPTRDQLSRRAGHILFTQGPEQPAATARETVILLDQLARAEERLAGVQSLIDKADIAGEWYITCSRLQWAIDGTKTD